MRSIIKVLLVVSVLFLTLKNLVFAFNIDSPIYTLEQATQGEEIYKQSCVLCHGENLNDGSEKAIVGDTFYSIWGGRTVAELFKYVQTIMPLGSPGTLTDEQYLSVLSYMFQKAGIPAGTDNLSSKHDELNLMRLPIPVGGVLKEEVVEIPPHPNPTNSPLEKISNVTNEMLINPPDEDWLMWRRSYDAKGFSPINNINKSNVSDLKVVWSWTMSSGRNTSTPLVHDGVMFMHGAGSSIDAFNAVTGDILWRYRREKQEQPPRFFGPRSIAIFDNKIISTTDDGFIIAIHIKTGEVVWEKLVVGSSSEFFSGGPLIADGKIILGTSTATASGKNFIVALDAKNGQEIWRFHTIPKNSELGNDSWNGASYEERQGAGIYTPGSYDPDANLVFFGTGNTYRPQLLMPKKKQGANNDGLYTNSTLALNADDGKLVWYFQHLPNDQWNYDWAYERTVITLPINGNNREIILTGGKQAIFEAMDLKTGQYLFSIDLGLQNVISAIDLNTGDKSIAPNMMPMENETRFSCPDSLGNRNWQPTSFIVEKNILITPYREACMKVRSPLLPGDTPHGQFGQKPFPVPDSDGNFGGLKAINLETKKTQWTTRRRAEISTGVLTTVGGLIFVGARDRVFSAHDQINGKELWRVRLNGVPSGGPISFSVNGKQYIAVMTGDSGGFEGYNFGEGNSNPENNSATIWVLGL